MALVDLELNLSLNRYKKLLWELTLQHSAKLKYLLWVHWPF